jgi:alcohol dehydrogenase (cytochrome c)
VPSPNGERLCPSHFGGKNWEPSAYNPELKLLYVPSIEGCNYLETVEQKDFVDQGGPIKPRERFAGGGFKQSERLYGSLKALDPTTGETKVNLKLEYPNFSGALATAGNLVFIGHLDGTLTAHDAKTLKELWSYSAGSGINAPPISYSINGKQYIAVLVGSKQPFYVLQNAPELKNTSSASMLFVFGL